MLAFDLIDDTSAPGPTHRRIDLSSRRILFDLEKEMPNGADKTGYPVSTEFQAVANCLLKSTQTEMT